MMDVILRKSDVCALCGEVREDVRGYIAHAQPHALTFRTERSVFSPGARTDSRDFAPQQLQQRE